MCRRIYRIRGVPFVLVHYLADRCVVQREGRVPNCWAPYRWATRRADRGARRADAQRQALRTRLRRRSPPATPHRAVRGAAPAQILWTMHPARALLKTVGPHNGLTSRASFPLASAPMDAAMGTDVGSNAFRGNPYPDYLPWDSLLDGSSPDPGWGSSELPPDSSSSFPDWPPAGVHGELENDGPLSLLVADFTPASSPPPSGASAVAPAGQSAPARPLSPTLLACGADDRVKPPAPQPRATPPPPPPGPTRTPSTPGSRHAAACVGAAAAGSGPPSVLVAPTWAPCQGGDTLLLCLPHASVDGLHPSLLRGDTTTFLCEFGPVSTVPAYPVGPASFQCRGACLPAAAQQPQQLTYLPPIPALRASQRRPPTRAAQAPYACACSACRRGRTGTRTRSTHSARTRPQSSWAAPLSPSATCSSCRESPTPARSRLSSPT